MDLDDIVEVVDGDAPLHQVADVGEEDRRPGDGGGRPGDPAGRGIDPDLGKPRPAPRDIPERSGARGSGGREGDASVAVTGRGEGVVVTEAHRLRNALVVHDCVAPEDVLGRHHALPPGRRGEVGRADDVSGGVDVLHARAHPRINDDRPVRTLLETLKRLRAGDEPGCEQDGIGLKLLAVGEKNRADPTAAFDACNRGLFADADPRKVAERSGPHLLVEIAEQPVPGDYLDLDPEGMEYVGELRRHHPAADNGHAAGEIGHGGECLVGIDAGKIGAGDLGDCRPRPGGRDDRVGPDLLVADEDTVPLQPANGSVDHLDPRPAGLRVENRGEFLLDFADTFPDGRVRDGRNRVEDAEILMGFSALDETRNIV
ncbi:hypothetical protein EI28_02950 [Methanoculleus sp. MH98A]|nr:hypothetical protein EI28_02950 [Methanoculleus sp. MH98A]